MVLFVLSALAALIVTPAPSRAETTVKDVLVAVRTLGFVANPPVGPVDLAVVFDPAQPLSLTDMKTVRTVLNTGIVIGTALVRPVPVPVTELDRLTGFRFVLLTDGLGPHVHTIADMTRGLGVLTISTDLSCVRGGQCVMGVASEPRVQVLVNRAASDAAAVRFAVSFRMMITEL
ncbi:MAG: hypothetical protein WCO00_10000 [Rhodospirillaceae bacterium]